MGISTDTASTSDLGSPSSQLADSRDHQLLDHLVARAVGGDHRAREALLAEIHPFVLRYCRGRLGQQETGIISADDVAQEVCLAVISALPAYTVKGLSFRAFVYGLAAHKVTDAFRAIGRSRTDPVPSLPDSPTPDAGPEAHVLAVEMKGRFERLLSVLTPRQREVLVLRIMSGLTAEATAEVVGSTPGAVRVTQHRALNRLRDVLREPWTQAIASVPSTEPELDKVLDDSPPAPTPLTVSTRPDQGLVDHLEVVDELGTRAVLHLNRAHFLLTELEPQPGQHTPRTPSDRWYRLYAQLELMHASPCAFYLLSAATVVDEVHVLAERGQKLVRHSRRALVREQVARHLDDVTPWTTQLVDHACTLSQIEPGIFEIEGETGGAVAPR